MDGSTDNVENSGTVYLVRAQGTCRYKIGFTSNINQRLTSLRTGSPFKIELVASMPGSIVDEKKLHNKFAANCAHNEWFEFEDPGQILAEFGLNTHSTSSADLVGKFFHSFRRHEEFHEILWQGRVIGQPVSGFFLVETFDWWMGCINVQQNLVQVSQMVDWLFYDSVDEMKDHFDAVIKPGQAAVERLKAEKLSKGEEGDR